MDRLTIGQMAEMNGVTRQTLRLYDEIQAGLTDKFL